MVDTIWLCLPNSQMDSIYIVPAAVHLSAPGLICACCSQVSLMMIKFTGNSKPDKQRGDSMNVVYDLREVWGLQWRIFFNLTLNT